MSTDVILTCVPIISGFRIEILFVEQIRMTRGKINQINHLLGKKKKTTDLSISWSF